MAESPLVPSSAIPKGFRFAAARAGLKASGRLDVGCIVGDDILQAAAVFTTNRVVAAPVTVGRQHLASSGGRVRAVVVNAGNANCATGAQGLEACERVCAAAGETFGSASNHIFPSSTGIIGVLLPAEKIVAMLPDLSSALGSTWEHFAQFANAIMTTDTRPKAAFAQLELGGKVVSLLGTTKGAGMIQPKLAPHATMLAYLMTDAAIESAELQTMLNTAVEQGFNRISIDGDTSTNDTALLLASGAAGAAPQTTAERQSFQQALNDLCIALAKQMVADGEGVQHVVELHVVGAHSDADALAIARAIANSPLVKTAWAGRDPNWGRLLAAVGNAGVNIEQSRISVHFGELEICCDGGLSPHFEEERAHAYLTRAEFTVTIDLHLGKGSCRFWTCDLTTEYVRINADYST